MEAHEVTNTVRCPQCGFLSPADGDGMPTVGANFLYFNNKKTDQPRFRCLQCDRNFTVGWHGRRQGRTYAKKRNVDPSELLGVHRQCPKCGVHDNAPFKFYNNLNKLRPRFKCKSCRTSFQMRVEHDETTGAVRLVHSGHGQRQLRQGPRKKRAKVDSAPQCGGGRMQSFSPPSQHSEQSEVCMSDEDAAFANMLEADLLQMEGGDEVDTAEFVDPPPTCPSEDFSTGDCNVVPNHLSFGEPHTCSAAMDPRLCRPFQSLQQPGEICDWQVHSSNSYSSSSSSEQQSFVGPPEEASHNFDDEEMKVNTMEGNLVDSSEAPCAAGIGGDAWFAAPVRNIDDMAEFGHRDIAYVDVNKVYNDLFGYYN